MADDGKLGEEEDLTLPSQRSPNNGGSAPASPASDAVAQLNAETHTRISLWATTQVYFFFLQAR